MATHDTGGQARSQRQSGEADVEEVAVESSTDLAERQDKLTDDVDAILDDIDEVLESNAEEFVRSYVQKGGQ
jgi:ubiquitin-like protein Pup